MIIVIIAITIIVIIIIIVIMIIVIIAITIIVIRIIEVKVIRIEILQGASLGMGSLHIKVIVSDIEGTICDCIRSYLMSSPWRKYCIHHLSNAYQASPYDPHSCTESCGWSRRRPSKQLPSSRRLESQP